MLHPVGSELLKEVRNNFERKMRGIKMTLQYNQMNPRIMWKCKAHK
jgi:hypothetical protein